jgi:hypothetical protein
MGAGLRRQLSGPEHQVHRSDESAGIYSLGRICRSNSKYKRGSVLVVLRRKRLRDSSLLVLHRLAD